MKILAIETSCDETALALVEASGGLKAPRFRIIKNIVSSQIRVHQPFGGVVPNLAKREHLKNLPLVFDKIQKSKNGNLKLDMVAVTAAGPGLEPCLWTGIEFAKKIHKDYFPDTKLLAASHFEGHLYSFLLSDKTKKIKLKDIFPIVALSVSGGHTVLVLMKSLTIWKKIGETRDDAVGEAFDKVARMLGLPYPGGSEIERIAADGDESAIKFPRPMINAKNYDFSFSGLKTSVLYYLRDNVNYKKEDVAASFQEAAIDVLVYKTMRAAKGFGAKSITLAGGVAANKSLRKALGIESRKLKTNFFVAPMEFNTDNAAMIAVASYIQHLRGRRRPLRAKGNLDL